MALVKAKSTIFDVLQTVYTAVTFHELFKEAALDANSKLDFGVEWQEIFGALQATCETDARVFDKDYLQERFDAIDKDGSGELDESEMRGLFRSMGRPISKRLIANIMRLSDTDGNGTIDFGEFSAIFDRVLCPIDACNGAEGTAATRVEGVAGAEEEGVAREVGGGVAIEA